ncbi:hypothetical protein [Myxosarcina sp. GI1(2024)]
MFEVFLFVIVYSFFCALFIRPNQPESKVSKIYPEQVFQIIDEVESREETSEIYDPWNDKNLGLSLEEKSKDIKSLVIVSPELKQPLQL